MKNKINNHYTYLGVGLKFMLVFFSIVILLNSCIEKVDLDFSIDKDLLSVDGSLSNLEGDQFIKITRNPISKSSSPTIIPEEQAIVSILEKNGAEYKCIETIKGSYKIPSNLKTKVGAFYKLRFILKNKETYESNYQEFKQTPEILEDTVVFDPELVSDVLKNKPGHKIYISLNDPLSSGDNYMWRWKLFEKQNVCATCNGGKYSSTLGRCVLNQELVNQGISYDYNCSSDCYEIRYSSELNVFQDLYTNGGTIKNRLVAEIPFYESTGFLVEIQQYNISKESFVYFRSLMEQSKSNGGLVDVPPSPLISNINNVNNPNESVGGYFLVGNVKTKRIWVPRKENATPQFLIGRPINPEPPSLNGPPLATCIESLNRTKIRPLGWPN
ncbi:MAG: DUF4249 family protein [Leadbetterella sp.]